MFVLKRDNNNNNSREKWEHRANKKIIRQFKSNNVRLNTPHHNNHTISLGGLLNKLESKQQQWQQQQ